MDKILSILQNTERPLAERYCQQRANAVYIGDNRLLVRVLGQYLMYVAANDTSLTPHLALDGYWEMWITQCLAREVKPGWRCIDVGANCGYFTALLADAVEEEGFVDAYEPQGDLCMMLEQTAAMNGWTDRIDVHCYALGAKSGGASLVVPGNNRGSASVSKPGEGRMIQMDQLDNRAGRVDLIKLDVEGHEAQVLEGASETLLAHRPILLMEWCRAMAGKHPFRHIEPLIAGGYELLEVRTDSQIAPVSTEELAQRGEADLAMLWMRPKV